MTKVMSIIATALISLNAMNPKYYFREGIVTETADGWHWATDMTGEMYVFEEEVYHLNNGDLCVMVLDNMGTLDEPYDDEIVNVFRLK